MLDRSSGLQSRESDPDSLATQETNVRMFMGSTSICVAGEDGLDGLIRSWQKAGLIC